jgi:hypothetical protein
MGRVSVPNTLVHESLVKQLCTAMLFACVTATAANARGIGDCVHLPTAAVNCKADLVGFKYRIDQAFQGRFKKIMILGTIINKSNTELEAAICTRLYDVDGFELDRILSDRVRLSPGHLGTVTGRWQTRVGARVVSLKAYAVVALFGCATSPNHAISPIVEKKMQNATSRSHARRSDFIQNQETIS